VSGAPPVHAVVFDCDGVLVDSERIAAPVLAQLLTDLGLPTTAEEVDRDFKGRSWEYELEVIRARRGGLEPWPDLRERYHAALFTAFDERLRPISGIEAALDALDAAGVPRCLASGSDHERIRRSLRAAGLLDRFPEATIFSAEDVEHGKPAPDLFLHATAQMGFDPTSTVIVEDSPTGVQAGVAADMRVLGYAPTEADADSLSSQGAEPFQEMARLPIILGVRPR